MTGVQVRRAREMAGLTRYRLGALCGIPERSIEAFEREGQIWPGPRASQSVERRLVRLRAALEATGIVFTKEDEPRLKPHQDGV